VNALFPSDELQRMSQINEIGKSELVQINDVRIDQSLPAAERIENYLSQIKNPYHFLHNGLTVHLRFEEDGTDLKSQMTSYFQSLKKV
jgi:hypothetical protein